MRDLPIRRYTLAGIVLAMCLSGNTQRETLNVHPETAVEGASMATPNGTSRVDWQGGLGSSLDPVSPANFASLATWRANRPTEPTWYYGIRRAIVYRGCRCHTGFSGQILPVLPGVAECV